MADHSTSDTRSKQPWIWMDGALQGSADAVVSVLDHGFLYGDSVYETLRTHDGRPFAWDAHLARLERSAAAIDLDIPLDRAALSAALDTVLDARPPGSEAGVRLMVTRGAGPLGLDIALCENPKVILIGWPVAPGPHPMVETGVPIVVSSVRRNPTNALNPHIKSGNFLNNILAYREAKQQGAFEAVLLTVDDTIAECTTSNLFWVRDGEVRSADDEGILLGVTRQTVLELFREHDVRHRLGRFPVSDLYAADEIFITSTLKGVLPVRRLDDERVGDGTPGELTRQIIDLYAARVASP